MKLGQLNTSFRKMLRLALLLFAASLLGSCASPTQEEKKEEKPEDLFAFLHKEKEIVPKHPNPEETADQELVKTDAKENDSKIQEKIKKLPTKAIQPPEEK